MSSLALYIVQVADLMLLVPTAQLITGKSIFHAGGGIEIKLLTSLRCNLR